MNPWIALVTSLPTENATARMRAWRALKAAGAAVLRDGVYLLPDRPACRTTFAAVAADILTSGGTAFTLEVKPLPEAEAATGPEATAEAGVEAHFVALFDRTEDYAGLLAEISKAHYGLNLSTVAETFKQARKLRKAFAGVSETDFFPGEARRQADAALHELEMACARTQSPDEPHAVDADIPRCDPARYRGRMWATRRRPWVDRLASAWLIRRFIDPDARILWLKTPADCPPDALGFDFDGAAFSHVGVRVTFEVLVAAFGIANPAIERLAALVHFLDVGGVPPAEAGGIESVLAGLRDTVADDDRLLEMAGGIFDGLLANFEKAVPQR